MHQGISRAAQSVEPIDQKRFEGAVFGEQSDASVLPEPLRCAHRERLLPRQQGKASRDSRDEAVRVDQFFYSGLGDQSEKGHAGARMLLVVEDHGLIGHDDHRDRVGGVEAARCCDQPVSQIQS